MVGTPIGNLDDMTVRAVNTLKEATLIAAEDTRQTRKLLAHFGISTPLLSYREHNRRDQGEVLLNRLEDGASVALVSDAGLPTVSDPGAYLVQEAVKRQIAVVPVPGANAALAALIASGMATDTFVFLGFLPRKHKACQRVLHEWKTTPATIVLYESPHRLLETLSRIKSEWGNRRAVVARELTKRHEEWLRGTIEELTASFEREPPRGECTLVVSGNDKKRETGDEEAVPWWHDLTLREHIEYWTDQGLSPRDAVTRVAEERKLNKRAVYNRYHFIRRG